jgi:galactokinase
MSFAPFFLPTQSVAVATAAGKLDILGGFAEYSGTLGLQMLLKEQTKVQAAFRTDNLLRVYSANKQEFYLLNLEPYRKIFAPQDPYKTLHQSISIQQKGTWGAHVAGCLFSLCFENRLPLRGMDVFIESDLPIGQGLASSAALQIATLRVLGLLYRITYNKSHLPFLAQKAAYNVVGTQHGLMDQLAIAFGEIGKILPIICQPDKLSAIKEVPPKITFWGIDTGQRMAQAARELRYKEVKIAAYMGYSMIAQMENLDPKTLKDMRFRTGRSNLPYYGYLCQIGHDTFAEKYQSNLPDLMVGADFLENFGETIDFSNKIDPAKIYQVNPCTSHPIYENFRARAFYQLLFASVADALEQEDDFRKKLLLRLGSWLYESHRSTKKCGLTDEKTDILVNMAQRYGAENEIFGARVTDKGIGGTVCLMSYGEKGERAVRYLHQQFCREIGEETRIFKA